MSWETDIYKCKDPSDYAYCTCAVYSCGYSQPNRRALSEYLLEIGEAETDCSAGVSWWLYKGGYLDECPWFSTHTEIAYLVDKGYELFDADLVDPQRNDVLWRTGHTALYIGEGLQAEALRTENYDAGYNGSQPGDQDDGETMVRAYPAGGWTYILRPPVKEEKKEKKDGEESVEDWSDNMLACIIEIKDDHAGYKGGQSVLWTASAGFEYINHPDSIKILDEISTYYTGKPLYRVVSTSTAPWIMRLAQVTASPADATQGLIK